MLSAAHKKIKKHLVVLVVAVVVVVDVVVCVVGFCSKSQASLR